MVFNSISQVEICPICSGSVADQDGMSASIDSWLDWLVVHPHVTGDPPTCDNTKQRQMPLADASSQIYELGGEKACKASQGCGLTMTRGK